MKNSEGAMVKRKIVHIDETKCNGCGECVPSCAEGAIQIVNGKAILVSDSLCDGLGACFGHCPLDAITIEERESESFAESATAAHYSQSPDYPAQQYGCPSARLMDLSLRSPASEKNATDAPCTSSALTNWPIQLHLLPPNAPFLKGADLLVCAPCVPFAMPDFHASLLKGRGVAIACPKLDNQAGYLEKLATMFAEARPNSVTVARMSVPCCGGLFRLVHEARNLAGSTVPIRDCVIGHDGTLVEEKVDLVKSDSSGIRRVS